MDRLDVAAAAEWYVYHHDQLLNAMKKNKVGDWASTWC